jgi:sterol desaturase/sphingolipid hydroxylase (fatty acid hydroxylase superfamily)
MDPELKQQLPTLRSQFGWLLVMLLVYFFVTPQFGVGAPVQRIVLNALSLGVWLALLVAVFVPLERLFALNRQPTLRPQLLVDIGYYFLTGLIPTLVLALPIALLAAISREMLPAGYQQWVASFPVAIKIVGALVIGEFGFYWAHRAMHTVPRLWQYHAPHHDPVRMDWLVNSRAHPVDIIFTRMCGLALVAISGFGSSGAGGPGRWIFEIVMFASIFWAFLIHANVKWRFGPFEHILSSPRFHHWHHSRDDHPNHNYASMLPVYDRLFGTMHFPAKAWPPSYGIAPENSPEALLAGQQDVPAKANEPV